MVASDLAIRTEKKKKEIGLKMVFRNSFNHTADQEPKPNSKWLNC